DDAVISVMFPIARLRCYRGETNITGYVLETLTCAAARLAHTRNLTVFGTIQTTPNHPVVVAKQLATIAQMSGNRVGLNVVAGWNKPEYEALGLTLPDDHETRYGYAQEWFDIIQKLWTHDGPFDWEGKYFQLKRTYGYPQPTSLPPIFNAAGSALGPALGPRDATFASTPAPNP